MSESNDFDLGASGEEPAEEDVFAGTPADENLGTPAAPIDLSEAPEEERLGGTDDPPLTGPPEGSYLADPEEEVQDQAPAVEDDDLTTAVEEQAEAVQPPDTPEDLEPEPEPEPEPEDEVPAEDPEPANGKSKTRAYVVMEQIDTPEGVDGECFVVSLTVSAHNSEGALRAGFRNVMAAAPETEEARLAVMPESMFKARTVKARHTKDVAIDIS